MARKKSRSPLLRLFLFVTGLGILIVFALFLVGLVWVGPLVKKAVEKYGPEALRAEVKVEEVDIGLFTGVAKVRGLIVGNPEGYSEPEAIRMDDFQINLRLASLRTDTIVIDDILIQRPVITYERHKGIHNLVQLQKNATAWAESLSKEEKEQKPPKKVIIKRLRIKDGLLRVKLAGLPVVPVKLPDIERTHIGEDGGGGQNFGHATKEVLASLYENSSEVVKNAGGAIEEKAKAALKASEKAGKDALKAGEKALDDVGDKIKGLFGQ